MADETTAIETEVKEQQTNAGAGAEPAGTGSEEKKYSDKEVNDISAKNAAKAEQKLLKSLGITDVEKAKSILKAAEEAEAKEQNTDAKALEQITKRAVKAEAKNVLAEKGFTGKKADRMLNLINLSDCVNEKGEVDTDKVEKELESIKADFPELFSADNEAKGGFKFGSEGNTSQNESHNKIAAENRKRWNRFNN
ncbi:MAG: hypothetical protein NC213_10285 [Acetobacter sp.]|nr:hypothetical protein [Bacteroides sp.]MCM1342122.1 hypothetical protein [Acetobacter sp.]MCM1434341.1 hypothetical protein [Clostridiales bacterium]